MKPLVFGLDISDRSVELVSLFRKKGTAAIDRVARMELPAGVIMNGVIVDAPKLAAALSPFFQKAFGPAAGPLMAGVAMPETQIFSKVFALPVNFNRALVVKALQIEARDAFPISLDEAVADFAALSKGKDTQDVLYAAMNRGVTESYRQVLRQVGVEPMFFDAEVAALARALLPPSVEGAIMLVDIGWKNTAIVIHDRGGVRMSSTIPVAGETLTASIEAKMDVSFEKAEEFKRFAGFDPAVGNGRVFFILQAAGSDIVSEMRRTVEYYHSRYGRSVLAIVLAGGTSLTPGIEDYVAANFPGIKVVRGNPWYGIDARGADGSADLQKNAVIYATATGLAMRALGSRAGPGLNFLPHDEAGGIAGFIRQGPRGIGGTLSSLFSSMVKRAKKSQPRKKKIEPSAVTVPEEILPAAAPPTPAALVEENAEPGDGRGVGELLSRVGGAGEKPSAPAGEAEEPPAPSVAESERISVESIISRSRGDERAKGGRGRVRPGGAAGSRLAFAGLIVLVLALFALAASGVYMFAGKIGVSGFGSLTNFFAKKSEERPPPAPSSVSALFLLSAVELPMEEKPVLITRIVETDVTASDAFPSTGIATVAGDRAAGALTVINGTSRSYAFVASTRFLSKDGVLFRLKQATAIPANGSVTAEVQADEPGPRGDIGPTTFTIPGFAADLQDDVYARSDAAMTGGAGTAKAASAADIASAKAALTERLKREAEGNFKSLLVQGERLLPELLTSSELLVLAPKEGAQTGKFTVTLSLRFRALLVPESGVNGLLAAEMAKAAPPGTNVSDYGLGPSSFAVESYDAADQRAEIRAEAALEKL